MREHIKKQFDLRSDIFDHSANWITDKALMDAHLELAGMPSGEVLDLCCGTGQVGRALKNKGWDVKGLDISDKMITISSKYFPVFQGSAEAMPFEAGRFRLVCCRQAFQFLDAKKVLSEVARVLAPEGIFVVSLTVPFSDIDKDWLYRIHSTKQPLLRVFYTIDSLHAELDEAGFLILEQKTLTTRESITRWMENAPELTRVIKDKVISLVVDAPEAYRKLHNVNIVNGEVFEDWSWVMLKTSYGRNR